MSFPSPLKDVIYKLLQEPTLDKFREFLRSHTGEHNSIDFKSQWIEGPALAKELLALANSQGGIIIFGVSENEDKSIKITGLSEIRDKAVVSNDIKDYVTSDLKYDIYDFSYTTSEYEVLQGKNFQMLVVDDTPKNIPFLSKKESGKLKQNMIYVRRGTSCEIANKEEIEAILNRRVNYIHPNNGEPLQLREHLNQLKVLYENIEKDHTYTTYHSEALTNLSLMMINMTKYLPKAETRTEPNPLYPEEDYESFIARMILEKKKKIERVLDLD